MTHIESVNVEKLDSRGNAEIFLVVYSNGRSVRLDFASNLERSSNAFLCLEKSLGIEYVRNTDELVGRSLLPEFEVGEEKKLQDAISRGRVPCAHRAAIAATQEPAR